MGLDMCLDATVPSYKYTVELAKSRANEYRLYRRNLFAEDRYAALKDVRRRDITDKVRDKEARDLLASFKKDLVSKAHSLGGIARPNLSYSMLAEDDEFTPVEEIWYWRKEWALHNFIVNNFGDPEDDNRVAIFLDEAALKKIIEVYSEPVVHEPQQTVECGEVIRYGMNINEFGQFIESVVDSDPFRRALKIVQRGGVVFYWAWY